MVGVSLLILAYMLIFTDMSFSRENRWYWVALIALSILTYGLDYIRYMKRNQQ
jgi:hypothetical protein